MDAHRHDEMEKNKFYFLDNAGFLYTAIASSRISAVYRISAKLTQAVDAVKLQKALDRTILRCPYFQVNLNRGFFWY